MGAEGSQEMLMEGNLSHHQNRGVERWAGAKDARGHPSWWDTPTQRPSATAEKCWLVLRPPCLMSAEKKITPMGSAYPAGGRMKTKP